MNIVEEIYRSTDRRSLLKENLRARDPRSMIQSMLSHRKALIIEYKRQSPSGFICKKGIDPLTFARMVKNYASALSVLSESMYFNGSFQDAVEMQHVGLPMLMKDFINREDMIESGYNAGYDAILLIADFLSENRIRDLSDFALSMGMESLVEFHDMGSYHRIPEGKHIMVGYNRRNLRTLTMEPEEERATEKMKMRKVRIMESGIDRSNFKAIMHGDCNGFLIGTSVLNDGEFLIELNEEGSDYHKE